MLANGVTIMLVGMGVVFLFLLLMVLTMDIVAIVIKKLGKIFPEAEELEKTTSKVGRTTEYHDDIATVLAVVHSYRK